MTADTHFTRLAAMYLAAPINDFYDPHIEIRDAEAIIEADVSPRFFHAAEAVHGSVYFKMLDDAAFFAASSLEREVFVLTTTFTTYLTRPVSEGRLRAVGKVVNRNRTQFIGEAVLTDDQGNELARGSGVFIRSKMRLEDTGGYGSA